MIDWVGRGSVWPGFLQVLVWVTSHLSLFLVTKNVTRHICHISGKSVTLSHTKVFFLTCDVFCHILPEKCHILALRVQKKIEREGMWRFGWDWNMFFLFPSQICHLSRKREAGRPFGLWPTLRVGRGEGTGTRPDYLVNRVLTNEGPHRKIIVRKSRNSFQMNSRGVGAHGQFDSEPK